MNSRSVLTFDRWDFLGTRALLTVIALAVTGFSVIAPVVQWWRGEPLVAILQTGSVDSAAAGGLDPREGVELTWPGEVSASIPDAHARTWIVSMLPGLLVAVGVVIVVVSLLRLLSRIQHGGDVARPALRTLRIVGATLILGALAVSVAEVVAHAVVMNAAVTGSQDESVSFTIGLAGPLITCAVGLVCGALAEAFAHLADDVEGLI